MTHRYKTNAFLSQYLHIFYWFQSQLILSVQGHMICWSDLCNCDCELANIQGNPILCTYCLVLSLGMAILLLQQCNCNFVICHTCSYVRPLSQHCMCRKFEPVPERKQKWDLMQHLYVLTVLVTMRCRWLTMATTEHMCGHCLYTAPASGWVESWQVGASLSILCVVLFLLQLLVYLLLHFYEYVDRYKYHYMFFIHEISNCLGDSGDDKLQGCSSGETVDRIMIVNVNGSFWNGSLWWLWC